MNAQHEELYTAEQVIEKLAGMHSAEKMQIREARQERRRKRLEVILRIERLEFSRCDKCREAEGHEQDKGYFQCGCEAAVEIRRLGKELDELTSPLKVVERRSGLRFSPGIVELAEKNGIPYATLYKRVVHNGWDEQHAATAKQNSNPRKTIWTDEMFKIVERETLAGKTAKEIWKKHFSKMMALRTFTNKTTELRRRLTDKHDPRAVFTQEDLLAMRNAVMNGIPSGEIRAAFKHIKPSTIYSRLDVIRKELKEEGKL